MRIWFVDIMQIEYDVLSPLSRPTGGTGLAVSNIAQELARRGEEVFVSTQIRRGEWYESGGATMAPLNWTGADTIIPKLRDYLQRIQPDVVIVLNFAQVAQLLRPFASPSTRWILWTHNFDEPWVHGLAQEQSQAGWDKIIFVSNTQRDFYLRKYHQLEHVQAGTVVIPNALSRTMASDAPWNKLNPVVAYTTVADRGIDRLIRIWPEISAALPDAELRVFSPMINYSERVITNPSLYPDWYRTLLQLPGVVYRGWQSHTALAEQLDNVRVVVNPNTTVPETFCLTNIEAMARGCSVLTGDAGAIREIVQDHCTVLTASASESEWVKSTIDLLATWNQKSAERNCTWVRDMFDVEKIGVRFLSTILG